MIAKFVYCQSQIGPVTNTSSYMNITSRLWALFLSTAMGEWAKKKCAADAKVAHNAKKATKQAQTEPLEDPASTVPITSSYNNLSTWSTAKKNTAAASHVPLFAAQQAAQYVEFPASTDCTLSDKKLPTQFDTKNSKKKQVAQHLV